MPALNAFAIALAMLAPAPTPWDADIDVLLKGVTEVVAPGCLLGPVAVYGDRAFPVMTGRNGPNRLPILGAARFGKGRVVLAGHEGMYGTQDRPEQRRLAVNTATWLCGERKTRRVLLIDGGQVESALREAGFSVRKGPVSDLPAALAETDVLFLNGDRLTRPSSAALIEAIARYIEAGGGYFDGVPGWGWQQLNPNLSLSQDFGGNKLTARMGIVIADGMVEGTGKQGFLTDTTGLEATHAGRAFASLSDQAAGRRKLTSAEMAQISHVLSNAAGALPATDKTLLPKLQALVDRAGPDAVPAAKRPLGLDNPIGRLACVLQNIAMRRAPLSALKAHPAAAEFPGAVPADAPRVERTVRLDTSVPDWASTGLYAVAGEPIEVTLPQEAVSAGLWVRIGPHTDTNWHQDKWSRFPEVSYASALASATTRFGSPFGGLVYIVVPRGCKLGSIDVRIKGAVEAPLFVLGQTPVHHWRETIRKNPAPWAELATRKVILTLPSTVVRDLDDPEALMAVWDHALDCIADLAAIPRERERPERICCDQQISAGYMHSGYPIMTWLDVPPVMVDRERLVQGGFKTCWGFWHELGHNHQNGDWTFAGTGETTVNLFSLYCCERVNHEPVARNGWLDVGKRSETVKKYFAGGAKFSEWQSDPGLSLMFYAQLQQAFGWGAYQRLFAEYRALTAAQRPRNDDEKRDQFMVRFSRQVRLNLGPFFAAWGIPVSQAARDSVAALPEWKPEGFREGIPAPAAPK